MIKYYSNLVTILGDPGAVSGGQEKVKAAWEKNWQKKVGEKARSPWGQSLTIPVPNSPVNAGS